MARLTNKVCSFLDNFSLCVVISPEMGRPSSSVLYRLLRLKSRLVRQTKPIQISDGISCCVKQFLFGRKSRACIDQKVRTADYQAGGVVPVWSGASNSNLKILFFCGWHSLELVPDSYKYYSNISLLFSATPDIITSPRNSSPTYFPRPLEGGIVRSGAATQTKCRTVRFIRSWWG
jgi:hypothetical protein